MEFCKITLLGHAAGVTQSSSSFELSCSSSVLSSMVDTTNLGVTSMDDDLACDVVCPDSPTISAISSSSLLSMTFSQASVTSATPLVLPLTSPTSPMMTTETQPRALIGHLLYFLMDCRSDFMRQRCHQQCHSVICQKFRSSLAAGMTLAQSGTCLIIIQYNIQGCPISIKQWPILYKNNKAVDIK